MGSVDLLDKTRKINMLLHNTGSDKVVFDDICRVLCDVVSSNTIVMSKKGKVLGSAHSPDIDPIEKLIVGRVGGYVDSKFNERILDILSTKENVNLETLGFETECASRYCAIVAPVVIAGQRHGTLFMYKTDKRYDIDDIILCEYAATVVGLAMMWAVTEESEEENRRVAVVKSAIGTLTGMETEAVRCILTELPMMGGTLVASRIADKTGITRSVIVNALKKLESAGIIESRSSGMKGTTIKVLNDLIYDEFNN